MSATGRGGASRDSWVHWFAFGLCGAVATVADMGLFVALHHGLGWNSASARPPAIAVAVVVGWMAHRRFTFRTSAPASWREFVRYAGVAWFSIVANYAVFLVIIAWVPRWPPTLAIVFSSAAAMTVSYVGMRFAVFRRA